ncbi:MAG: SCO family protein [Myxococcales bacterium]|nr:SCO family protein [Myxococcales bacterium]MBK7194009.1 SCO family protein [Myxococcales bacterium]MBP6847701.1 SCO family protein [Kofleriaceae bacterium]
MRIIWTLVVAGLLGACHEARRPAPAASGVDAASPSPVPTVDVAPGAAPAMAGDWASPLGNGSIYDLELTVRTADGASVPLASLAGAPAVITMFYATCPAACPRLIDDLKGIEQDLDAATRARVRFVLVSFDPARDTPAKLRELAGERQLGPGWLLTAADDGAARELAAALGIKYRALDSGEFFHTSVLTVLDDTGRPRARVEGLGRGHDAVLAALR